MKTALRTHTCGELTEKNIGQKVTLFGWVDTIRDHGGLTFIDLRDRYGKTQIVMSAAAFKPEDCLQVTGTVKARPKGTENPKISTGPIEVVDAVGGVRSASKLTPFEVTKSQDTNEDLRLQYRYLDLRNPAVQENLFTRHRVYQTIRRALDAEGGRARPRTPGGGHDRRPGGRSNNPGRLGCGGRPRRRVPTEPRPGFGRRLGSLRCGCGRCSTGWSSS